ncbi:aminodeoxychorismate lyase [Marinomonas sp.]
MTWFVNYQISSTLPVTDRGLAYGDGVFETIHAYDGKLQSLDTHLTRLHRGLKRLAMPLNQLQSDNLFRFLDESITQHLPTECVVKVIVTRGEGGRGYMAPDNVHHNIMIGILPAPNYQQQQIDGVKLDLSPVQVNSNPLLAGIKHLNRLENVIAKQHLSNDAFEALMLDVQGNIIECIQSNIFWFKNGQLCTPQLNQAGVCGTYRQKVIEQQTRYPLLIAKFSLADIQQADEIFITNSLMGIVPVTIFGDRHFAIGQRTRTLQSLMQFKD